MRAGPAAHIMPTTHIWLNHISNGMSMDGYTQDAIEWNTTQKEIP